MRKTLGLSVIGGGRVARHHLDAIHALTSVELVALVDSDSEKAGRLAAEYGAKRHSADFRRALEDGEAEAVIISGPTPLHYGLTMEALASGKHVLVEKPMAETGAQAVAMVQEASHRHLVLMVGQVMRFMPVFAEAKALIAEGRLGRPIHALERRFCYRTEVFPWWRETRGFLIAHHGSHTIDLFLWLLGATPVRVYADVSSNFSSYPGEDDFALQVVLANNAVVALHHSFLSRHPAHDIVIIGEGGTLSVECFTRLCLNDEEIFRGREDDVLSAGFAAQLEEFTKSISEGRNPISSGAEVITTMLTIDAARKSAEEHKVVELSA